jgi:hypothetical protein
VLEKLTAPMPYTAFTCVRRLENLFFLQHLPLSLYLNLQFSPHVEKEMSCLQLLQGATVEHLLACCQFLGLNTLWLEENQEQGNNVPTVLEAIVPALVPVEMEDILLP